jgi:hypothetical protein
MIWHMIIVSTASTSYFGSNQIIKSEIWQKNFNFVIEFNISYKSCMWPCISISILLLRRKWTYLLFSAQIIKKYAFHPNIQTFRIFRWLFSKHLGYYAFVISKYLTKYFDFVQSRYFIFYGLIFYRGSSLQCLHSQ